MVDDGPVGDDSGDGFDYVFGVLGGLSRVGQGHSRLVLTSSIGCSYSSIHVSTFLPPAGWAHSGHAQRPSSTWIQGSPSSSSALHQGHIAIDTGKGSMFMVGRCRSRRAVGLRARPSRHVVAEVSDVDLESVSETSDRAAARGAPPEFVAGDRVVAAAGEDGE